MSAPGMASEDCRRASPAVAGSLLLMIAALLFSASPPAMAQRDTTPPTFGGLNSATTCVPGPVGGGRTTSYHLSWNSATDDRTPSRRIVYDVYQASALGGENFSAPTYTTPAGATTFDTPPFPTDKTFYFVVRARDSAGNSDSNTVEREGQNLCV